MLQEETKIETNTLYMGSLSRTVYFLKTNPQRVFQFNGRNLRSITNKQSIRSALSYRFAQKFIHPKYQFLYIPCTPAIEITEINDDFYKTTQNKEAILGLGLIKVSPNQHLPKEEFLIGYQSGKRSALIEFEDHFYRLKGCGNLDQGFPTQVMVTENPNSFEIRGCHFEHTVKRELLISDFVTQILNPHGVFCGNNSIGFVEYNDESLISPLIENPLNNSCPEVPKFCGVFQTLSDKRLGTHLMQGIQILTMLLLSQSQKNIDINVLLPLITKQERIESFKFEKEQGKWHLSSTYSHVRENETLRDVDLKDQLQQNNVFDQVIEEKSNIDTIKTLLESTEGPELFRFDLTSEDHTANLLKLLKELKANEKYIVTFQNSFRELLEYQNSLLLGLFLLYERLGYEIGKIKRIFIDNDLNWGYYRDHHRNLYHCNAHLNNFIVLPSKHSNILAPIDFDLAFRKHEFISIEYDFEYELQEEKISKLVHENKAPDFDILVCDQRQSNNYGKFDPSLWNWFLESERQSLEMAIAGIEMIMNSIMQELDLEELFKPDTKEVSDNLDVLLRDQMRIGYLNGMTLEQYHHQDLYDKLKPSLLSKLIECGLILSSDVVA